MWIGHAYVNNASSMSSENQLALKIFIPIPFIERTRGNQVFALDAEALSQDRIAIEGVKGEVGAAREEDGAGDVVDSGTFDRFPACVCQDTHEFQAIEIP